MTFKKGFLAVLAVSGFALAAQSASAQACPPPMMHHGMGPGPGPDFFMGADLTKKQHKQIDAIFKKAHNQEEGDQSREAERDLHTQIQDLLSQPGKLDRDKIASLQQQLATIRAQRDMQHLDVMEQIHDVLTPEQLTQIKDRETKERALMDQLRQLRHPDVTK